MDGAYQSSRESQDPCGASRRADAIKSIEPKEQSLTAVKTMIKNITGDFSLNCTLFVNS